MNGILYQCQGKVEALALPQSFPQKVMVILSPGQTGASGVGLGALLLQETEGERCPLLFLRRELLDQETR